MMLMYGEIDIAVQCDNLYTLDVLEGHLSGRGRG